MSENKENIIIKKIEISKPLLWLIWLILFLFPSILAIVGFNYFKSEYIYFSKIDLINQAFDRIRLYNESIAPEVFIEGKIKELKKLDTNQSLENLKSDIEKIVCGKTLFCMFFNKSADKATIIKSDKAKNISINFLKKYISKLQIAYQEKNKDKKAIEIANSQQHLGLALQSLFKSITNITISKDKVSKNFSVIHNGELYFILIDFEKATNDCSSFFAVIQGEDFSFRNMLETLHIRFPEIKILFKEIDVNRTLDEETGNKNLIIHSGIKQEKDKILILAPASLIFSRHVLHDGKAELNSKFGNLIPFIEYHIPIEKTKDYLKKINKVLYFVLFFINLISSIYFLNISMFGFNTNLKFKNKIAILTLITSIFPFSIFSIGIYSINNYNRFITKLSIQHQAEIELQIVNLELDRYISIIEDKLNQFGKELNEILLKPNLKASDISDKLKNIAEEIPVSKELLYLDPVPNSLKTITLPDNPNMIVKAFSERASKELTDEQNGSLIEKVPPRILELAKEKEPERSPQNYFSLAYKKVESNEIVNILQNSGKLIVLPQQITNIWYEVENLYTKNSEDILGLFMTKFEARPILHSFLNSSNFPQKRFKTIIDKYNYEIKYAFIPIEQSGTATIWEQSGYISDEDKKFCLKNPQSGIINMNNKIIIKKRNQKIPHLAIATISELVPFNKNKYIFGILALTALYLLFIFLFTNKLIDIILIEPVKLLALNANAIAKGSEIWNTEINSGDEFEDLNNNFKNLVTGLRERNILKSYVSEDAFSDIEGSSDTNLKPGGEYMEATIVFSAIKDYDKLSLSITPEESIKILSKFMSLAEEVTKKYNGSIDKIIGDTIMLVFRNNTSLPSHGLRAAQASLELVEKAKEAKLPNLYTGIASGRVISGKIGSYTGKLDFTVIGNPVNSAARFKAESKNGTEKTGIIISGTTIGLTKGRAKVKFLRRVAIKGKSRMYNIYELVGIRE